jgi:hypothetical protein
MTISANFPTINPSLNLDFANSKALDPRITFSRPTTATYYDAKSSAVAEQNLQTYSEDFTNITWTKSAVTASSNTTTAPDGATTADSIIESATTAYHNFYNYPALITGQAITGSIYLKANTRTFALVCLSGPAFGGVSNGAIINLSTGAVGSSFNTYSNITVSNAGNGWYRISVTGTTSSTNNGSLQVILATSDSAVFANLSYAGDGTSGIYAWGAQLEQRSAVTAYTPTTTTAITNYIPVLQTAVANDARFDHNPTTRESLGLLIEEQRTNLLTYSADFSNAIWTKSECTITPNVSIAPDGSLTANKLASSTASTANHYVVQTYTGWTSGTTYTVTMYAKSDNYNFLRINMPTTAFGAPTSQVFNLSTGALGAASTNSPTSTITAVGNGWYRCSMTKTATATASGFVAFYSTLADATSAFTGNGYSGIFIWGAQLEAGAFATSYIPTVASQVTRSPDSATLITASWFNPAQGTAYIGLNAPYATSTNSVPFAFNNGSFQDSWGVNWNSGGGLVAYMYVGGNYYQTSNLTYTAINKAIASYGSNTQSFTYNGNSVSSVSYPAPALSAINALKLGGQQGGQLRALNGCISKFAYYPIALTSVQLQALTGS